MSSLLMEKIISTLDLHPTFWNPAETGMGNRMTITGKFGGQTFILERNDFREITIKCPMYHEFGYWERRKLSKKMDSWKSWYLRSKLKAGPDGKQDYKVESES